METTNQALSNPYTILDKRILWFDGDSSYTVKGLADKILSGEDDWIDSFIIDPEDFSVKRFNDLTEDGKRIKNKTSLNFSDEMFNWNIPNEYKELSINNVVFNSLESELRSNTFTETEIMERVDRVNMELKLWEERGLSDLLKSLMYIVDTFMENGIIWGTGRGSSCCSYVLYLIGVHDVDSIYYELDIADFFRA
jgi:DNA polymerase III alpha subunit